MIARRRRKLGTGVLAGVAASAAAAAALAVPGSAQTSGTTLHLTALSQKSAEFYPRHKPVPGDQLGFGDVVSGDDHGTTRAVCTLAAGRAGGLPCTIWMKLSKGTLQLQGLLPQKAHNAPVAVIGGTGAYNGARGTAFATDVTATKTAIVVDLLP
jgi:hypothetical protein